MGKLAFISFLSTILLIVSCSTTSQKSTNQDLEVNNVKPFAPSNEILDANSISPELIAKSEEATRFLNPNKTIKAIKGEITDELILQDRDLSLYDKADTNKCGTRICIDRQIQEFVWQHWKNKKPGYIFDRWQGIDVSATTHIFIEQNKRGEWIVSWKMARKHAMLGNDITETFGIVLVKQILLKNGRYKLELKNENGETVQTL